MTTNKDKFETRISSGEWGISKEYTVGVPLDGSADPTGENPKRDYFYSSSINQAARGAKVNRLWYNGSHFDIDFELVPQKASIYPFAQVNETPSGHSIEVDDTPGGERILFKHRTGAGIELKPDGSIVVSSKENKVEVVGGDYKLVVSGSGDLVFEGNLNLNVTGDLNLKVGGNYNVEVGANENKIVSGSSRSKIGGHSDYSVSKSMTTRSGEHHTSYVGGDFYDIVKGGVTSIVSGDIKTHSGNGAIEFTTNDKFHVATGTNISLATKNIKVSSESGFIGGNEVTHYGKIYTGPNDGGNTVKGGGVTFYGSLVGRAFEAWTSKFSLYADEAYEAHISNYATVADHADDAYRADWSDESNLANGTTTGLSAPGTNDYPVTISGATVKDGSKKINKDPAFSYGTGNDGGGTNTGVPWTVNATETGETIPGTVNSSPAYAGQTTQDIALRNSSGGVKNVWIDSAATRQITSDRWERLFQHDPNLFEIRSLFRSYDISRVNSNTAIGKVIQELISQGRLNAEFNIQLPSKVDGLIAGKEPSKIFGKTLLGNPNETRSKSIKSFVKKLTSRTIVPDPRYNPDASVKRITPQTLLSKGIPLSIFLGSIGDRTSLDYIPFRDGTEGRLQIVRNLYLHAHMMELVNNHPDFNRTRLVAVESIFAPKNEEVTVDKLNTLKARGRAVVYQLLNTAGEIDYEKTFMLAVYLKDHFVYEELILDYDTFSPDGKLGAQIILVLPNIPKDYSARFKYKLKTQFNQQLYASTELARIMPNDV